MADLSSAVQWWEEWQLRILVLGSLVVQWLLFLSSPWRRYAVPSWFRSLIWLAYLSSDALAIYALATLFNHHKNQDGRGSSVLKVVWTPVLLMHLGGQDTITAYNIEDNELWRRHVLTALSQVTVAIYVFCKSWPRGDKRLLQAAIVLFVPGVLKCLEKPWALKSASINSLISSRDAPRPTNRQGEINSLEDYVKEARAFLLQDDRAFVHSSEVEEHHKDIASPYKLFVDLASPYPDRLGILKSFWVLDEEQVHRSLRIVLSYVFRLLYTKAKMSHVLSYINSGKKVVSPSPMFGFSIRNFSMVLSLAAIGLFHNSHREDYNDTDVKITYALLCCTAVLELSSQANYIILVWPEMVSQHSLIGFSIRNKKHKKKVHIVSSLGCRDFLDQHWSMKSCSSARIITKLVLQHVKAGWKDNIQDAASYRMFNDLRGQRALQRYQDLGWSIKRPFDESVLLWHIATDFCFYEDSSPFPGHRCAFAEVPTIWSKFLHHLEQRSGVYLASHQPGSQCGEEKLNCKAVQCRQISNYMIYLLFVNPEMLLPGTRRNLFTAASDELQDILKDMNPPLEEGRLIQRTIKEIELRSTGEGFIYDAWALARGLLALGDEQRWEVIQGVWVEMLCFSAGRCRGHLHAKALGTGGELLTYVWLLLSRMGMETFAERLQTTQLPNPSGEGNADADAPSTSAGQDMV
ncbi:uncharacterized protein LOC133897218 [Phragmites australis]|uniref:uncharacterized protein LOC133897218 n=1 Tax=Phragmites australis TaxID=29695 RepID=UPI002D7722EE|nr:uncharacterized protein LOC133897218 [Phragmites australis]